MLTPFLSLPFFALGYWDKAEPMVLWFHLTAALCSLCLGAALLQSPQPAAVWRRICHPYVLAPLALGMWSILIAPFQDLPWLSIFGTAQSGLGALWFLDCAALGATALLLIDNDAARKALTHLAIGTTFGLAALKFWDSYTLIQNGTHLLIFVPSYYGWLGLVLPILSMSWLALTAAAAITLASHSATAMGALALEMGLIALFRRFPVPRRAMIAMMIAAAILPGLILHSFPILWQSESLRDRHLIGQMALTAIMADPWRLLIGHGWGRMQDAFQIWLNVSGEQLWNPSWIFMSSDYFSSHNWALDTLHATGIPGVLLFWGGLLVLPLYAMPQRQPHALALAICLLLTHGLWFQLPLSLPLTALAQATLADEQAPPLRRNRFAPLGLGFFQLTAVILLLVYGLNISHVRAALNANHPAPLPTDWRGSDLAAAELIKDSMVTIHDPAPLRPLLAFLDLRIPQTQTLPLITTGLTAMAQIYVTGEHPGLSDLYGPNQWRSWLKRLLYLAPDRTDQAIPYFTWLLQHDHWEELDNLSSAMLDHNAQDPVGLYYQGIVRLKQNRNGLDLIRQSLQYGMARFMPIDPAVMAITAQPHN